MNKAEFLLTCDCRKELGAELANGDDAIATKPAFVYDGTYWIEVEDIESKSPVYTVTVSNESRSFTDLVEAENFLWSCVECDPNYDDFEAELADAQRLTGTPDGF